VRIAGRGPSPAVLQSVELGGRVDAAGAHNRLTTVDTVLICGSHPESDRISSYVQVGRNYAMAKKKKKKRNWRWKNGLKRRASAARNIGPALGRRFKQGSTCDPPLSAARPISQLPSELAYCHYQLASCVRGSPRSSLGRR
jgi:hypothetical protein